MTMHSSEETEALEIQAAQWLAEAEGSGRQAMELHQRDYQSQEEYDRAFRNAIAHAQSCAAVSQAYSMLIIARKPVQR